MDQSHFRWRKQEMYTECLWGNFLELGHLEGQGDGRITLKWTFGICTFRFYYTESVS